MNQFDFGNESRDSECGFPIAPEDLKCFSVLEEIKFYSGILGFLTISIYLLDRAQFELFFLLIFCGLTKALKIMFHTLETQIAVSQVLREQKTENYEGLKIFLFRCLKERFVIRNGCRRVMKQMGIVLEETD